MTHKRNRKVATEGPYELLDTLVSMLGKPAPADAIRVFRENRWMDRIPALRDFDPDRSEHSLHLYPNGGHDRPPSMADWFRAKLGL